VEIAFARRGPLASHGICVHTSDIALVPRDIGSFGEMIS
jgi:hypothetical protein